MQGFMSQGSSLVARITAYCQTHSTDLYFISSAGNPSFMHQGNCGEFVENSGVMHLSGSPVLTWVDIPWWSTMTSTTMEKNLTYSSIQRPWNKRQRMRTYVPSVTPKHLGNPMCLKLLISWKLASFMTCRYLIFIVTSTSCMAAPTADLPSTSFAMDHSSQGNYFSDSCGHTLLHGQEHLMFLPL